MCHLYRIVLCQDSFLNKEPAIKMRMGSWYPPNSIQPRWGAAKHHFPRGVGFYKANHPPFNLRRARKPVLWMKIQVFTYWHTMQTISPAAALKKSLLTKTVRLFTFRAVRLSNCYDHCELKDLLTKPARPSDFCKASHVRLDWPVSLLAMGSAFN